MPVKDAITTVLNRNTFYRDGYRLLLRISIIQGLIIGILVFCIVGLITLARTQNVYFATSTDGRIINLVPLNAPYRTEAELVNWAASTAQAVMRFGFHDYRDRLQQASNNFTNTGWESFSKALKESHTVEAILAHKLVVTLEVNAAPEIQSQMEKEGIYTWYVKIPVTISYQGTDSIPASNTTLYLRIVRVSTLQNPEGLSIEQWVTSSSNEGK